MEGGFTNGVANEWTSYVTNGEPIFSAGVDKVHTGTYSQKIEYPEPAVGEGYAGIYQVVACNPGQDATLAGWKYDRLFGKDPWALICRLGYDLTGGTDPRAGTVAWTEFPAEPHKTWLSQQVQFTTTGSAVTIYVEAWHKGWNRTHIAWFDDITLDGIGGPVPTATNTPIPTDTAVPTDTPVPTNTPTATPTSGTVAAEDFDSMPSWSSSYDAPWGNAASWSIQGGGESGNHLQSVRTSQGSSDKVSVYSVPTNTDITISVFMRCPSMGGTYWMESGYRLGSHTAQDFDENSAAWTLVQKFDNGGTNGNGDVWTQYSTVVNTGSNTQISIGYKLGSSGGGTQDVGWDTLRITR
jgi:hypothetical protein